MTTLSVRAEQKRLGSGIRRNLVLGSDGELRRLRKNRVFYDIPEGATVRQDLMDAYVAPVLMLAMAERVDVVFHGPVSRAMIYNAHEFMAAWVSWRPQLFSRVEIRADSIVDAPRRAPARAIQAFSGGVDALFTTWTHRIGGPLLARRPLEAGLLVHGFDIPLDDDRSMELAHARGRLVLEGVGIPLFRLKTNMRKAIRLDWEMFHGAAIASALMQFSEDFDQGLIGSSGPYDSLEIPWGSNPITDRLAGGGAMDIVHDGAGNTRNDKIKAIAGWPLAADNLRVCWRNADASQNCGVCEKCIRTALAFLAHGHPVPRSLKSGISVDEILACPTPSSVHVTRFRELRDLALKNGISAPWVEAIGVKLQSVKPARMRRAKAGPAALPSSPLPEITSSSAPPAAGPH